MEKIWSVVRFTSEDTVEAVPSTWIINNKCYWPTFQTEKTMAAIRRYDEPNTCWPSYDILTFRNSNYDSYGKAREKAKKAEYTSELNSDIDYNDKNRSKRKIIRKKFSSPEESTDDEFTKLPPPPTMQRSSKTTCRGNRKNDCIQKLTNFSSDHHGSLEKLANNSTTNLPDTPFEDAVNNNGSCSKVYENHVQTNAKDCTCYTCPAHANNNTNVVQYFQEIIRQQAYFKTQLWQMSDDFRELKINIGLRENQQTNLNHQREQSILSFELPFKLIDVIEEEVEQFLNRPQNFQTSVEEISRVGGKNPYDFVKRNCTRMISNELAEKYSWLGAKQKRKFSHLKFADLLIAAGQHSNPQYTKKILEEAIQKWLRRAKERWDAERKKLEGQRPI